MSFSPVPGTYQVSSPEVFLPDIRCNLDSQFEEENETEDFENMCIYARIRPMLPEEKKRGFKECIAAIDEKTVRIVIPESSAKYKSSRMKGDITEDYTFTAAFGPETGQFVFFQETVLNCMETFVKGSNSLIFSYGITGSGKTYTLQGNSDNPGIIPLSLRLYFAVLENQIMKEIVVKPSMYNGIIALSEEDQHKEHVIKYELLKQYDKECEIAPGSFRNSNPNSFAMTLCNLFSDSYEAEERQTTLSAEDMASAQAATLMKETIKRTADNQLGVCSIWVSFVEIYNENIFDLLQPMDHRTANQRTRLNLGEDKNGNVYIKGAREICVFNSEEALKILNIGRKNLSIASTKMNYQSSRSHCIYTIKVVRIPDRNNISYGKISRFSFCDLAGSERTSKTHTTGMRLKEAGSINTSLLVLGRCIEHLRLNQSGRDKRLIPFRESKLTRIFSGFFMGQGKAVMIANASPSDYTFDETLHVLKFSAVAKSLMVSTFFSEASTSIQSICNQWDMLNNITPCNESMESDTDSSVIQMKDELIEKLLGLVEEFRKKEQEMAELEMRVREEVCDEYREFSDQLLEDRRLRHEEEIEELKRIYEKRLASMEKMYEDIIQGYKDQFNESDTEESFASENSVNVSKSFKVLDESLKSEHPKSGNNYKSEIEDLKQNNLTLVLEKKELEEKLVLTNEEIKELQADINLKSSKSTELEKLNNVCEEEIEKLKQNQQCLDLCNKELERKRHLANEELTNMQKNIQQKSSLIMELQNQTEKLKQNEQIMEADKKDLESKLIFANEKLASMEKDIQEKSLLVTELQNSNNVCEEEIEKLKQNQQCLDLCNKELERKLHLANEELTNMQKNIQQNSSLVMELQNQIEKLEQNEQIIEADKKDLESKLIFANESLGSLEKDIREKSLQVTELQNLNNNYKLEINEARQQHICLASEKQQLEEKLGVANKELEALQTEIHLKSTSSKELEQIMKACSLQLENLQKDYKNLQLENLEIVKKSEEKLIKKEMDEDAAEKIEMLNDIKKEHEDVIKLKDDLKISEKEKRDLMIIISDKEKKIKDQEEEILTIKDKLRTAENDMAAKVTSAHNLEENLKRKEMDETDSIEKLQKLSEIEKKFEEGFKFKEDLKMADTEKQDLMLVLSDKEKRIKDLEEEIINFNDKLRTAENDVAAKSIDIHTLKEKLRKKEMCENDAAEKLQKFCEIEKEIEDMMKLKEDLKIIEREKQDLMVNISRASENDVTEKTTSMLHNLKEKLKKKEMDENDAAEKLKKLSEIEKEIEDIGKSKEDLKIIEREKQDLMVIISNNDKKIKDLQHELKIINDKLRTAENDAAIKSVTVQDLEHELKIINDKIRTAENDVATKSSTIQDLKDRFAEMVKETEEKLKRREVDEADAAENLLKLSEIKKEYEEDIMKFKEDLKIAEKEKKDLMIIISDNEKKIKDLEEEVIIINHKLRTAENDVTAKTTSIHNLKEKLKRKEMDENDAAEKLQKLCEIEKEYEDMKKLKEDLKIIEREKQDLMVITSKNNKKIKDLEHELKIINDKLRTAENDVAIKSATVQDLKDRFAEMVKETGEKLKRRRIDEADAAENLQKLNEIKEEYEENIKKIKEDLKITEKEKKDLMIIISDNEKRIKDLEEEVIIINNKLRASENDVTEKTTSIHNLKEKLKRKEMDENDAAEKLKKLSEIEKECEDMEKLKEDLKIIEREKQDLMVIISNNDKKIKDFEHELEIVNDKLRTAENDVAIKSATVQDLKDRFAEMVKETEEKLKRRKMDEADAAENLKNLSEIKREYEENIKKFKEDLKITKAEKQDLMIIISDKEKRIKDLEDEIIIINDKLRTSENAVVAKTTSIFNLKEKLKKKEMDENDAVEKLQKLCEIKKEYEGDIKKFKKDLKITKKEKEDLMMIISDNEKKIEDLKNQLLDFNVNLKIKDEDVAAKTSTIQNLKDVLDDLYKLLNVLENCEMEATKNVKHLNTKILKQKAEILELKQQIQKRESSMEELEKALNDAQINLKEFQALCEEKKKVGKENKKDTLLKKSASMKEKENLPKNISTRSLRQSKQTKMQDISFSSVDSNEPEVTSRRNPKRLSDEDFEPGSRQARKKAKAVQETKIPVRSSRRKLEDPNQNLSPLQKVAFGVSSKFRNIADNISKISSPMKTRGRRKLFNPDTVSSLKTEKITRKKM